MSNRQIGKHYQGTKIEARVGPQSKESSKWRITAHDKPNHIGRECVLRNPAMTEPLLFTLGRYVGQYSLLISACQTWRSGYA